MYARSIDGIARMLRSPQRGPDEVDLCRWIYDEIQARWRLPGTWLDFKPVDREAALTKASNQYLCRISCLERGRKRYGWNIPGFGDKKMAAACCIDIAGDRSAWRGRILEYDSQIFWGLEIPRGTDATEIALQEANIGDQIEAIDCSPAEFLGGDLVRGSFGGWRLLGYRVKGRDLRQWSSRGGLRRLLDCMTTGLATTYEACAAAFG